MRDFAQHFGEQVIQIFPPSQLRQVHAIFLLRCGNIQAVVIRVVQKVALDPPHLFVHLVPFRARVDVHLHLSRFTLLRQASGRLRLLR